MRRKLKNEARLIPACYKGIKLTKERFRLWALELTFELEGVGKAGEGSGSSEAETSVCLFPMGGSLTKASVNSAVMLNKRKQVAQQLRHLQAMLSEMAPCLALFGGCGSFAFGLRVEFEDQTRLP